MMSGCSAENATRKRMALHEDGQRKAFGLGMGAGHDASRETDLPGVAQVQEQRDGALLPIASHTRTLDRVVEIGSAEGHQVAPGNWRVGVIGADWEIEQVHPQGCSLSKQGVLTQ